MADFFGAGRVRLEGTRERRGYTLLRKGADDGLVECAVCGELPADPGNWIHACHAAMEHVKETGHEVTVQNWQGAVYGPEK